MVKMISDLKKASTKKNEEQIIRQLKTDFKEMSKKQIDLLLKNKELSNKTKTNNKRAFKKNLGTIRNFELTVFELEPGAKLNIKNDYNIKNIYCITWKESKEKMDPLQISTLTNNTDNIIYILLVKVTE